MMQALKGPLTAATGLHKTNPHEHVSLKRKLDHESGPVIKPSLLFKLQQLGRLENVPIEQTDKIKDQSTDQNKHVGLTSISAASFGQAFKPLNSNISISKGGTQIVSDNLGTVDISATKSTSEDSKEATFSRTSNSATVSTNNVLCKTNSASKSRVNSKVIMSTVPKRVPLISTVGNASKLFAAAVQVQASQPSNKAPVSCASTNNVPKTSKSILEARLTSSISNSKAPSDCVSRPFQDKALPDLISSQTLLVSSQSNAGVPHNGVLKSNVVTLNDCTEGLLHGNKSEDLKSSVQQKLTAARALLSYEKGLTRFVPVKSRTVIMVDVGLQVFLPDTESVGTHAVNKADICDSSQLAPVTFGKSSFTPGTSAPSTSESSVGSNSPLKPGQFVAVNSKTGKMMLAIPKHLLLSAKGPQTVFIGGKPVKLQIKGCTGSDINLPRNTTSSSAAASILHLGSSQDTNITITNNTCTSISSSLFASESSEKTSAPQCLPPKSESRMPSDLPPNKNITSFSSFPTETRTTSSSRSDLSLTTPVLQTYPKSDNSIVLPFNSMTESSSKDASVHTIPNSTSLFILLPNSPKRESPVPTSDTLKIQDSFGSDESGGRTSRHSIAETLESPQIKCTEIIEGSIHKENKVEEDPQAIPDLTSPVAKSVSDWERKRVGELSPPASQVKKKENAPVKDACEPHISNDLHTFNAPFWNSMDTIMNSESSCLQPVASTDMTDVVKDAFNEFKNCFLPNKEGNTPLHVAVEEGNIVAVKRQCILLAARKASVNLLNVQDESPLQLALVHGFTSIVKVLLNHGADALVSDKEENSTLHLAVRYADFEALEALLLSKQFKKEYLNHFNDEGLTPLHIAAQLNKVKEINLLCKFGCEVDIPDAKSGRTALYHAVERRRYRAQQALVRHGADMKEPTFFGSTPLLATKSDLIAQLTSEQHTVIDVVDPDSLLAPKRRSKRKSRCNKRFIEQDVF